MRWLLLFLLLSLATPAHAQPFQPPGLEQDSQAYAALLAARQPAGGTPQARRTAETRAAAAERRGDWTAVAAAWEARIAAGEATGDHWLALARAQLRRAPPEPARAAQAGWRAFAVAEPGVPEIPALLVMAEAFRVQDRPEQAIAALEAVASRAPDDLGGRARAVGGVAVAVQVDPHGPVSRPGHSSMRGLWAP